MTSISSSSSSSFSPQSFCSEIQHHTKISNANMLLESPNYSKMTIPNSIQNKYKKRNNNEEFPYHQMYFAFHYERELGTLIKKKDENGNVYVPCDKNGNVMRNFDGTIKKIRVIAYTPMINGKIRIADAISSNDKVTKSQYYYDGEEMDLQKIIENNRTNPFDRITWDQLEEKKVSYYPQLTKQFLDNKKMQLIHTAMERCLGPKGMEIAIDRSSDLYTAFETLEDNVFIIDEDQQYQVNVSKFRISKRSLHDILLKIILHSAYSRLWGEYVLSGEGIMTSVNIRDKFEKETKPKKKRSDKYIGDSFLIHTIKYKFFENF